MGTRDISAPAASEPIAMIGLSVGNQGREPAMPRRRRMPADLFRQLPGAISNALPFAPTGPEIARPVGRRADGAAQFSILVQGPGIGRAVPRVAPCSRWLWYGSCVNPATWIRGRIVRSGGFAMKP